MAVPSAVFTSTVNPPGISLSNVAVKVIAPSSSLPLTSAMVTVAKSLSLIVPVAEEGKVIAGVLGFKPLNATVNVSSVSNIESSITSIENCLVSPFVPEKFNVPELVVKSVPPVAVPATV